MSKAQKKALRFAYRLMRGDYKGLYMPFVSGYWIEPDRAQDRPYLNEETFAALELRGYLECQPFMHGDTIYLYRLSREGCDIMGWDWPLSTYSFIDRNDPFPPLYAHRKGRIRRAPYPPRCHPAMMDRHSSSHSRRAAQTVKRG